MISRGAGPLARLGPRQVVWIVALAALVAFLPSLLDGFVFDDDALIVQNPYAHGLGYLGRCFSTDLWDTPDRPVATAAAKFYRPLVCASNIANWKVGGGSAWSFHLVNVFLHAAAAVLAARLALRWTGSATGALIAALLFAVHPSRSESVVWISGRTDLLMMVLLLGAHELGVSRAGRSGGRARWAAAGVLWVLALLSKEFAVCWPVLLAVEVALTGGGGGAGTKGSAAARRSLVTATALSLAGTALYLLLRARTLPIRPAELESMALSLPLHAAYVALSLGYYAERIVMPWPQTFHFRPVAIVEGRPILFVPSVVVGACVAVLFVSWIYRAWARDRALAVILIASAVVLLPVLNVSYTGFPGTTADRFLYLPLLPLAIAASRDASGALRRWTARPLSSVVVVAGALLCSAVNWVRSLDYLSNETLWRHEIEVNPNNPLALAKLAEAVASLGDADEASGLLRRAMSPEAVKYGLLASPTRCYLGLLELQGPRLADGSVEGLDALLVEQRSLALFKGTAHGRVRAGDLDVRAPTGDEYFRVHVANAEAHLAAAGALVASRLGHDPEQRNLPAGGDLVHELVARIGRHAPLDAATRYNLALALGRAGDYAGARGQLSEVVRLDPTFGEASGELAATLEKVEQIRARARTLPEPDAALARARAFLDLGAYLRAARELHPAHGAYGARTDVLAAYFDALVSARLDVEADQVAEDLFGPALAPVRLAEARSRLSRHTAQALAPDRALSGVGLHGASDTYETWRWRALGSVSGE
jgi:tetratricopeptide (TPR) repeat protein